MISMDKVLLRTLVREEVVLLDRIVGGGENRECRYSTQAPATWL